MSVVISVGCDPSLTQTTYCFCHKLILHKTPGHENASGSFLLLILKAVARFFSVRQPLSLP